MGLADCKNALLFSWRREDARRRRHLDGGDPALVPDDEVHFLVGVTSVKDLGLLGQGVE